jgi:hypothetical protein
MLNVITCMNQCAMASLNLADCYSQFAVIPTNGVAVPISFPLSIDGMAVVIVICLCLWFQLNIACRDLDALLLWIWKSCSRFTNT